MNDVINNNLFLIKEHIGLFKAANNFDVYDPTTGEVVMECREPTLGFFTKLLRFDPRYKRMTPFDIQIRTPDGQRIVRIRRGVSFFRSNVIVTNDTNHLIGKFRQKLFSIGGKFDVLDKSDRMIFQIDGKWTSWDFKFVKDNKEYGHVSKKWSGLGKEMFTSADNYMLEINNIVPKDDPLRTLILAAVICIDMVLKE